MIKSIEDQVSKMAELCPQFEVRERDKRNVVWVGTLTPQHKTYTLRISYRPPLAIELFKIVDVQPHVQVLEPVLERHPEYEEGPIPHIYRSTENPDYPYLCLFDPVKREWLTNDWIAETTVPWSSRWLCFYEGWLATGKWRGGGRHPVDETIH